MANLFQAAQQFVGQVFQNNMQNQLMTTPWANTALQAIQNGDQATCQKLATNIMKSYGFSSPEEAVQQGLANLSRK